MLMGDDDVPASLTETDAWGGEVMTRLADGWCAALDRGTREPAVAHYSRGIAHELNTPLAVVKGLVDKLAQGEDLSVTERALLARDPRRLRFAGYQLAVDRAGSVDGDADGTQAGWGGGRAHRHGSCAYQARVMWVVRVMRARVTQVSARRRRA